MRLKKKEHEMNFFKKIRAWYVIRFNSSDKLVAALEALERVDRDLLDNDVLFNDVQHYAEKIKHELSRRGIDFF
jgi:hypothetical protein